MTSVHKPAQPAAAPSQSKSHGDVPILSAAAAGGLVAAVRTARPLWVPRSMKQQAFVVGIGVGAVTAASAGATLLANKYRPYKDKDPIAFYGPVATLGVASLLGGMLHLHNLPSLARTAMIGGGAVATGVGGTGVLLMGAKAIADGDNVRTRDKVVSSTLKWAPPALLGVFLMRGMHYGDDVPLIATRVNDQFKEAFRVARANKEHWPTPLVDQGIDAALFKSYSKQAKIFVTDAVPVDSMRRVFGADAQVRAPVRVFAALQDGRSAQDRVDVAITRLRDKGAFSGDLDSILIGSPTGTGFLNPAVIQSHELLSRGRTATVAVQYSNKSSALSLPKLGLGAEQTILLARALRKEIDVMPAGSTKPKVYVFGESLGAWSSQKAVEKLGGMGALDELGIDKVLWTGTPHGSPFKNNVMKAEKNLASEKRSSLHVETIEEFEQAAPKADGPLKAVFLTHPNDAINLGGPSVLWKRPEYLSMSRPTFTSDTHQWMPIFSFYDMAVDEIFGPGKVAGAFHATGHDYRAVYPSFVHKLMGHADKVDTPTFAKAQVELARLELRRVDKTVGKTQR